MCICVVGENKIERKSVVIMESHRKLAYIVYSTAYHYLHVLCKCT